MIFFNFEIIKGDTVTLEITVSDLNNRPFNLSESTLYLYVFEANNTTTPVITISQSTHINPSAGLSIIEIPANNTKNLDPTKNYLFEIKLIKNANIHTLAQGKIVVKKSLVEL